jgi:hypothetical protein
MLMSGGPQRFESLCVALPVRPDRGMNLPVCHLSDDVFDLQGGQIPQAV